MTASRFGLAALALALCFWTPPCAWAGPVPGLSAGPADAADFTPELELATVTEVEMRRVTPPVPRDAAWAHARATAWLNALRRAAAAFPRRWEIRMGVSPAERLALAAQLYRAAAPPLAPMSPAVSIETGSGCRASVRTESQRARIFSMPSTMEVSVPSV